MKTNLKNPAGTDAGRCNLFGKCRSHARGCFARLAPHPRKETGAAWLAIFLFVAGALTAEAAEPFFFIQLTDPQFGMFEDNTNFVQETANFEFAVAAVNRLQPAFVVITGDLVNRVGDPAQIAEYKRVLGLISPTIPVYNVAGNHDVGNVPTPETIAAYTRQFGPDHYVFRHHGLVGIVLDSNLIQAPQKVSALATEQMRWLEAELQRAREDEAKHIVVFQHHPLFLKSPEEPDEYFNLPRDTRLKCLALFQRHGVAHVFCGHLHRDLVATNDPTEVIISGPVGKPLGGARSGIQVAVVRDGGIEHQFYDLGEIPNRISLESGRASVPAAQK